MGNLKVIISAAISSTRHKFQMVPWWLWLFQIACTSFFCMFFFATMSDFAGNPEVTVRYVVIGNVVQSIAATTLYAISGLSGTEKHMGTLSSLMQTPSSLFCIFLGMSLINIIAGLLSSGISMFYAQFVFGIDLTGADMLSILVVIIMTILSLAGFGIMIGSIGLRLRTSAILANIFSYLGLLICGVNFPLSYLPDWIQAIASVLPLTYGVKAMRGACEGGGLSVISDDLLMMVILGAIYFVISILMFGMFERKARKLGTYDMF